MTDKEYKQADFFKITDSEPKAQLPRESEITFPSGLNTILKTPEQQARAADIIKNSLEPLTAEAVLRIMQEEDTESNKISYTKN